MAPHKRTRAGQKTVDDGRETRTTIDVDLVHGRYRNLFWAAFGLGVGVLGLARFGVIGKFVGAGFVIAGLASAWAFLQTLLHEAGEISLAPDELRLPTRLCSGATAVVPVAEIVGAWVLRRKVPMWISGPLLVIDTRRGQFRYPRDWFGSEADQVDVARVVQNRLNRL